MFHIPNADLISNRKRQYTVLCYPWNQQRQDLPRDGLHQENIIMTIDTKYRVLTSRMPQGTQALHQ